MSAKKVTKRTSTKKNVKKATKKIVKKSTRKKISKKNVKNKIAKKTIRKITTKKRSCHKKKCKPENAFWINNGPVVDSVEGLLDALKTMSNEQYEYHTRRNGNDFAKWLDECICNKEFAGKLRRVRSRAGAIKALSKK